MPQPKIGLSMLYTLSESFSKMIRRLPNVQASFVEILDDGLHTLNRKRVLKLKEAGKSGGMDFSVHAPFADMNIASPSKPILKATLKRLQESLEYAYLLEAELWVIHPGSKTGISMFYPGEDWKQNVKSIEQLSTAAKDYGVRVAIENLPEKYGFLMKSADDFERFYDETGLEDVGVVLDVGHANLEGQVWSFLEKIPEKLVHLHVSDNHGEEDQHLGLGYGSIDYQKFAAKLKETGFSGSIVTESVTHVDETLQKMRELFL